jgi:hypothetical protein
MAEDSDQWQTLVNMIINDGFEILTVVTMNSMIFWVVTPCSLVDVYQYFKGTFCLCVSCFAYSLVLKKEAIHSS